jgi:hypothetical protein
VGKYELQRALAEFDELVSQARDVAIKLRDFQSARRPLERLLNQSLATILGPAIGVPVLGLLLLWFL